ncbi:MAG: hypothetical protein NT107_09210 [Planctomycetota bacterium]|jgi:hypothetical protein|nr:hypothetical protein [Planctomycetota bacterium]
MSMREIADQLIQSFDVSTHLLDAMRVELEQRRAHWVSARPSTLATPAQMLEASAKQLATEDVRRGKLLATAASLLPALPGLDAAQRRVTVSRIAPELPFGLAARLRQSAAMATKAARAVRGEVALGTRLLAFAARAEDSMLSDLAKQQVDTNGYDRNARRVSTALVTGTTPAGRLIDGRM